MIMTETTTYDVARYGSAPTDLPDLEALPISDRLDAILDWVERHPERHRQSTWAARLATTDRDYSLIDEFNSIVEYYGTRVRETLLPTKKLVDLGIPEGACGTAACVAGWVAIAAGKRLSWHAGDLTTEGVDGNGSISEFARDYLSLNRGQAAALFCSCNGLKDLRRIALDIKNGQKHPFCAEELLNVQDEEQEWGDGEYPE
jgi:hypothetical protein